MEDPKALALFQEILKKTEAGKLAWDTTAEEDKFVAIMLGRYTLTLVPYTTIPLFGERQESPSVTLEDEKQNIIVHIHRNIEGITEDSLQQLLVFARRTALHADEKIDEILEELQKPELTIISAKYGAGAVWRDVTSRVRTKIQSESLNVRVTNEELGGDPAPNVAKVLVLEYRFGDQTPESRTIDENAMLTIP